MIVHDGWRWWLNPAEAKEDEECLGQGGELSVPTLLRAYKEGLFPWYNENQPILWWSPNPRAIFNLDQFYVSRRTQRTIRSEKFTITVNQCFKEVMKQCGKRYEGTWITAAMLVAYGNLHEKGHAHSLETWFEGKLVGGVYGVSIGAAFFAESMFYRVSDASKVALTKLVDRLRDRGFLLLDTQVITNHTESLGAIEIPRSTYLARLKEAINVNFCYSILL